MADVGTLARNSLYGAGSLTDANRRDTAILSNINNSLALSNISQAQRDLLNYARMSLQARRYQDAARALWNILGSPGSMPTAYMAQVQEQVIAVQEAAKKAAVVGQTPQHIQKVDPATLAKSGTWRGPVQNTQQSTPSTVVVQDTLGREIRVSDHLANALKYAPKLFASKYNNWNVLPEEVANAILSGSHVYINSKGLYEWAPVSESDKKHLAQENRAHGKSRTTLTAGAAKSEWYEKNWNENAGHSDLGKGNSGSGSEKIAKMKETTKGINSNASAKSGTAKDAKATVIKKEESKKTETKQSEKEIVENAVLPVFKSNVLQIDPKTGEAIFIAEKKSFADVKAFKTVDQIAKEAAINAKVAHALAEAHKINPKGSKEYFEGVENVTRRNEMSSTEVLKSDWKHAGNVSARVMSPVFNEIDKALAVVDKIAANTQIKFDDKGHISISKDKTGADKVVSYNIKKGSAESVTFNVKSEAKNTIDDSVILSGGAQFAVGEYRSMKENPLNYAAELGVLYVAGAAFGAGTAGAKALTKIGISKAATKVGSGIVKTGLETVGKHGVDAVIMGGLVGGVAGQGVAYFKTPEYKAMNTQQQAIAKVDYVESLFKLGKEFGVGGLGFSKGMKGADFTIGKISEMKVPGGRVAKPEVKVSDLPSDWDITNPAKYANNATEKRISSKERKMTALENKMEKLKASGKPEAKTEIKELKRQVNALKTSLKNEKAKIAFAKENYQGVHELAEIKAFDNELANLREMMAFADSLSKPYQRKSGVRVTDQETISAIKEYNEAVKNGETGDRTSQADFDAELMQKRLDAEFDAELATLKEIKKFADSWMEPYQRKVKTRKTGYEGRSKSLKDLSKAYTEKMFEKRMRAQEKFKRKWEQKESDKEFEYQKQEFDALVKELGINLNPAKPIKAIKEPVNPTRKTSGNTVTKQTETKNKAAEAVKKTKERNEEIRKSYESAGPTTESGALKLVQKVEKAVKEVEKLEKLEKREKTADEKRLMKTGEGIKKVVKSKTKEAEVKTLYKVYVDESPEYLRYPPLTVSGFSQQSKHTSIIVAPIIQDIKTVSEIVRPYVPVRTPLVTPPKNGTVTKPIVTNKPDTTTKPGIVTKPDTVTQIDIIIKPIVTEITDVITIVDTVVGTDTKTKNDIINPPRYKEIVAVKRRKPKTQKVVEAPRRGNVKMKRDIRNTLGSMASFFGSDSPTKRKTSRKRTSRAKASKA